MGVLCHGSALPGTSPVWILGLECTHKDYCPPEPPLDLIPLAKDALIVGCLTLSAGSAIRTAGGFIERRRGCFRVRR
jgi:hypothetical protein